MISPSNPFPSFHRHAPPALPHVLGAFGRLVSLSCDLMFLWGERGEMLFYCCMQSLHKATFKATQQPTVRRRYNVSLISGSRRHLVGVSQCAETACGCLLLAECSWCLSAGGVFLQAARWACIAWL